MLNKDAFDFPSADKNVIKYIIYRVFIISLILNIDENLKKTRIVQIIAKISSHNLHKTVAFGAFVT